MLPSVTVITPTTEDRALFNQAIEKMISRQVYGGEIQHLFDYDSGIIGEKRNRLCEQAIGDIILNADSDDRYAPDWVSKSVQHLINTQADITGLSNAYFYKAPNLYEYTYSGGQPYVIGASMCYWRRCWEKKPFRQLNSGEDAIFQVGHKVIPHYYKHSFLATIHGNNTASHKQLSKMKRVDNGILENMNYL